MGIRTFLAATSLTVVGAVAAPAPPPMTEAPPAGSTGGFGEPTCAVCHLGSDVNAFGGSLSIEGLPGAYVPGESYLLTVVLRADDTAVAGFQLSARFEAGAAASTSAGRFAPVDLRAAITDSAGVSYAHHTRDGSTSPDASGSTWSVQWSPPEGGGAVVFHAAANSGNADNSPLGDLVYVHRLAVPEATR